MLDLEGYKKFWAIMSAQEYVPPTIILNDNNIQTQSLMIDGDLTTKTSTKTSLQQETTVYTLIADYSSIASRMPSYKMQAILSSGAFLHGGTVAVKTSVSDDNVAYVEQDDRVLDTGNKNSTLDHTVELASASYRYVKYKITLTKTFNVQTGWSGASFNVYEIYDANSIGGTASLSFEVRDANDNWFEAIPSSEFGTVTQGLAVAVQVGDTLTKRFLLPSTQTDFRAKLAVTGGGVNTGVTIIQVS